jgi:hypothetical protein
MNTEFWTENLKGRYLMEELERDEMIVLTRNLEKYDAKV